MNNPLPYDVEFSLSLPLILVIPNKDESFDISMDDTTILFIEVKWEPKRAAEAVALGIHIIGKPHNTKDPNNINGLIYT